VLTAVCVSGLALAVLIVVRWGGRRRLPMPLVVPGAPPTFGTTLRRVLRAIPIALLAGGFAGMLTAGLGGRLMMRVIAATSGDEAQGRLTEAEEQVGQISLDGTLGLVVFIGLFGGLLGGIAYLVLRRWLPASARMAGVILGILALGLAPGIDALNPDNVDFEILKPDLLVVAMLVPLFLLYGMTVASLVERADRSWPLLEWRPVAVAAHLPLLLLLPAVFALLVTAVVVLVVILFQRVGPLARFARSPAIDLGARGLLAVTTVASLAWCGANVADILDGGGSAALTG